MTCVALQGRLKELFFLFILTGVAKNLELFMGKLKELAEFQQRFAIQLKIPVGYSKESSTHRSLHAIFKQWKIS